MKIKPRPAAVGKAREFSVRLRLIVTDVLGNKRITGKTIQPVTTGQIYWGAVPFVGIQLLMGQHSYEWNQMMAMSALGCLPVLLLFLLFQRYFIGGMTAGAVKV